MQYEDYKQLRAYSRYDGVYLAILWAASFALTVLGDPGSPLQGAGSLIVLSTPFFVAYRMKKYRDTGLGGCISYGRAVLYSGHVFFEGGLLFALFQWGYMQFIDGGRLASLYRSMLDTPEMEPVFRMYGMTKAQFLQVADVAFSPVMVASQSFIMAVVGGAVLSLVISAIMQRSPRNPGQWQGNRP